MENHDGSLCMFLHVVKKYQQQNRNANIFSDCAGLHSLSSYVSLLSGNCLVF